MTTPQLSAATLKLIDTLESQGYETWVVGGTVRDAFLKRPNTNSGQSQDVDLCTQALWQELEHLAHSFDWGFYPIGVAHGTSLVIIDGEHFEVSTMRKESDYSDARHPDQVEFCTDIHKDLKRRDFTINALAFHPQRGLIDDFGGLDDIANKRLHCVGSASKRFSEDALRMLRALRFAAQLDFNLETELETALHDKQHLCLKLSGERIFTELSKLICAEYAAKVLISYPELICGLIDGLDACRGFDQKSPYHCYDVYEHSIHVLEASPTKTHLRWAALLHDIAKPDTLKLDTNGHGHFKGHEVLSSRRAQEILRSLNVSRSLIDQICKLITYHDKSYELSWAGCVEGIADMGHSPKLFYDLLTLKAADEKAKSGICSKRAEAASQLKNILDCGLARKLPYKTSQLAISGSDITKRGITGPACGRCLQALLTEVSQGRLENQREALINSKIFKRFENNA